MRVSETASRWAHNPEFGFDSRPAPTSVWQRKALIVGIQRSGGLSIVRNLGEVDFDKSTWVSVANPNPTLWRVDQSASHEVVTLGDTGSNPVASARPHRVVDVLMKPTVLCRSGKTAEVADLTCNEIVVGSIPSFSTLVPNTAGCEFGASP